MQLKKIDKVAKKWKIKNFQTYGDYMAKVENENKRYIP